MLQTNLMLDVPEERLANYPERRHPMQPYPSCALVPVHGVIREIDARPLKAHQTSHRLADTRPSPNHADLHRGHRAPTAKSNPYAQTTTPKP